MKKIALLGISGSIGESAMNIVREHKDEFSITLASVHNNIDLAVRAALEFHIPKIAVTGLIPSTFRPEDYPDIAFYFGKEELIRLLKNEEYEIGLNAVSGSAGLPYTMAIIGSGRNLALANKESLVMAGHLVQHMVKEKGLKILPVDSEHSALFQVLHGHDQKEIRYLHLTASGGPFRTLELEKFKDITIEQALKHPTWSMGTKVTLDSATMLNKGLEVIEAHWLFNMDYQSIKACIHPQSIIHSMVEFVDGSIVSQMSIPSMQLPILYALSYPLHIHSLNVQTDLYSLKPLTFERVDEKRYPLFYLACSAGQQGGLYPTIMNAANEKALALFLRKQISFQGIYETVDKIMNQYENIQNPDLETILKTNDQIITH